MKIEKEFKSFKMMEINGPGPNKTRKRRLKGIIKLGPKLAWADGGYILNKKRCKS